MLDVTLISDIGYGMGSLFGLPSTVATTNYYFVNKSLHGMLYFANRRGDSDCLTTILNGAHRTGFDRSYKITEMVVKYYIWNPKDSSKVVCKVANIRRGILR